MWRGQRGCSQKSSHSSAAEANSYFLLVGVRIPSVRGRFDIVRRTWWSFSSTLERSEEPFSNCSDSVMIPSCPMVRVRQVRSQAAEQ